MVDRKEAYDRQCSKVGVEAFAKCGARLSLIPRLKNYFQKKKKICVKWHENVTQTREPNCGGPTGSILGNLEYEAQTNSNTEYLTPDEKYKFVDELSILEIINLLSIGLCSYNMKAHVASDIKSDSTYTPPDNLKSQIYLNTLSEWTDQQQLN